jgi:hypothetical protein
MSALPPKADLVGLPPYVRFVPKADLRAAANQVRSITSSARPSSGDPLAKSLRRHTHTELMTVNLLKRAFCALLWSASIPPSRYRVFGDES